MVREPVSQLPLLDYWLTDDWLLTTWIAPPERGLPPKAKPAATRDSLTGFPSRKADSLEPNLFATMNKQMVAGPPVPFADGVGRIALTSLRTRMYQRYNDRVIIGRLAPICARLVPGQLRSADTSGLFADVPM